MQNAKRDKMEIAHSTECTTSPQPTRFQSDALPLRLPNHRQSNTKIIVNIHK